MSTITRRQKRAYKRATGDLKRKRSLTVSAWREEVKNNIKEGLELHRAFVDHQDKMVYEQLQKKEESIIEWLRGRGYDEEQIKAHLDSWYQSLS
jgi:predicted component of type VI protein secretion system